jgi:hypothetical protein
MQEKSTLILHCAFAIGVGNLGCDSEENSDLSEWAEDAGMNPFDNYDTNAYAAEGSIDPPPRLLDQLTDTLAAPAQVEGAIWLYKHCKTPEGLKADLYVYVTPIDSGFGPLWDFHAAYATVHNSWGRNKNNVRFDSIQFWEVLDQWTSYDNVKAGTLTPVSSSTGTFWKANISNWYLSRLPQANPSIWAVVVWDRPGHDISADCEIWHG